MKFTQKNKIMYNIIFEIIITLIIVITVFLVSQYIIGYFTNNNLILSNDFLTRLRRIGKVSLIANIYFLFLVYFIIKYILEIFMKNTSNFALSYIIFVIPYYILSVSYNITLANIGRSWNIEDIKLMNTALIALAGRKNIIDNNIIVGGFFFIILYLVLLNVDNTINKHNNILNNNDKTINKNIYIIKLVIIFVLFLFSNKIYNNCIIDDSFIEDIVYTRGAIGTLLYRYKNRVSSIGNFTKEEILEVYNKYNNIKSNSNTVDIAKYKDKNIIIIIEESMSQIYEESLDYINLPILKELKETYQGNLYIYNRFGFTAYSEREFLTGFNFNNSYYAESYDYDNSLIKEFNDMGYNTTSIHFCTPEVYRYGDFYKNIGFRNMYFKNDGIFEGPVSWLPLDDRDTFNNLLSIIDKNKTEYDKNLYYVVTTSAHDIDNAKIYDEYNPNLRFDNLDEDSTKEINNYFTFMKKNNDDLEYLFAELKKQEEEYLVLVFGDHPYKFKNSFNSKIIKNYDIYKEYMTPFMFWSNKEDLNNKFKDYYMIPYLYVDLLDFAGAKNTVFLKFLRHMREHILSINDVGIYSKRLNSFIKYEEMDDIEKELISDLKIINYAYFNKEFNDLFFN